MNTTLPMWKKASLAGIAVGMAMVLAAVVISDVRIQAMQDVGRIASALAIAGGVLALVCVGLNYDVIWRAIRRRKTAAGANFALLVVITAALTALICYISTRRFTRIDMTGARKYSLHSKTERTVRSLERDTKITWLHNLQDPRVVSVYGVMEEMLAKCQALNPRLSFDHFDATRQMERTQTLLLRLGEQDIPGSCVIVEIADRHEIIPFDRILKVYRGYYGPPKLEFAFEAAFLTALAKLTDEKKPVVYVLTGHGERPLEGKTPAPGMTRTEKVLSGEQYSLSRIVSQLKKDNFKVRSLSLADSPSVPEGCAVLIVPGPQTMLAEDELRAISSYLAERDGRMLAMVDSIGFSGSEPLRTNLSEILAEYGVRMYQGVIGMVEKPALTLTGQKVRVKDVTVSVGSDGYASHPVTSDLSNYTTAFRFGCPLQITNPRPQPMLKAERLLSSGAGSWGETNLQGDLRKARFNSGEDVRGPLTLGVVIQPAPPQTGRPPMPPMNPDEMPGPRLVVLGSSSSFTNAMVSQYPANLYLVVNAVNWMTGRIYMVGIPPKDIDVNRVTFPPGMVRLAKWLFVGLIPAAIVVFGVAVWQIRKR